MSLTVSESLTLLYSISKLTTFLCDKSTTLHRFNPCNDAEKIVLVSLFST